jgi:hypothetical protein
LLPFFVLVFLPSCLTSCLTESKQIKMRHFFCSLLKFSLKDKIIEGLKEKLVTLKQEDGSVELGLKEENRLLSLRTEGELLLGEGASTEGTTSLAEERGLLHDGLKCGNSGTKPELEVLGFAKASSPQ